MRNRTLQQREQQPAAETAATGKPNDPAVIRAECQVESVSQLVQLLQQPSASHWPGKPTSLDRPAESQLAQVRLGIASALFEALRAKDPATARHSLRVALTCSAWSTALGLSDEQHDAIEVACLLHDVGKIGIPDHILLKPAPLTVDEVHVMQRHAEMGLTILKACCSSESVLEIVRHKGTWYDGAIPVGGPAGEEIPIGARMLAIADAFDSMVTDAVYRPALSRERAFGELFRAAGSQFDPKLVEDFCAIDPAHRQHLELETARRWLFDLKEDVAHRHWQLGTASREAPEARTIELFHERLLEHMRDAVIYIDRGLRIVLWNHGAERLTGISSQSIEGRQWSPALLVMRDQQGVPLRPIDCPVSDAMESNHSWSQRVVIRGRDGSVPVEAQIMPVAGHDGRIQGVALMLRDVSSEISLEERCHALHRQATQDPLTQVANRAEFNRVHELFVAMHLEQRLPCSLVMCDLDYFKQVNDTFGHQAGDAVLVAFASLLRSHARAGDLVARYGGEEFVMLCADCTNATAARRAEELRSAWARTAHPALSGATVTASFGVTEIQPGDTPETMLRRADRALLRAKQNGRNTVVQLGTGISGSTSDDADSNWSDSAEGAKEAPARRFGPFGFLRRGRNHARPLVQQELVTAVPMSLALEKLRGFVSDHHGEMERIDENRIRVKIGDGNLPLLRRRTDRRVPLLLDVTFRSEAGDASGDRRTRTQISVVIRPQRGRDRRQSDIMGLATRLLKSLRAYLMASEDTSLGRQAPLAADSPAGATTADSREPTDQETGPHETARDAP